MDKSYLRRHLTTLRQELTASQRADKSERICELLIESPMIAAAAAANKLNCLMYAPHHTEVNVRPFAEWLWSNGGKVILPRILAHNQLAWGLVEDWDSLIANPRGILQPSREAELWTGWNETSLVLVPGLGFDVSGRRIGYGGGYYDRFIQGLRDGGMGISCAGIAFAVQVLEELPGEPHDQVMDMVLTEQGWTSFN